MQRVLVRCACWVAIASACSPLASTSEQTVPLPTSASALEAAALPTTSAGLPAPKAPATAAIDATFSQLATTVTQADAAVPLLRVAAVKAPFAAGQAVWWAGLVGATLDSNGNDIAVLAVWDVRSRVSAVVEGTAARGIVTGTGQRQVCRVDYVSRTDEVRVGDRMVTSDPTKKVPNDLLICTVSLVKRRDDGVYQDISCDSAIDIGALTQVLLLVPPAAP